MENLPSINSAASRPSLAGVLRASSRAIHGGHHRRSLPQGFPGGKSGGYREDQETRTLGRLLRTGLAQRLAGKQQDQSFLFTNGQLSAGQKAKRGWRPRLKCQDGRFRCLCDSTTSSRSVCTWLTPARLQAVGCPEPRLPLTDNDTTSQRITSLAQGVCMRGDGHVVD